MTVNLRNMTPDSFDAMVKELVVTEFPDACALAGKAGDEGIDALVGSIDEHEKRIFQAKFFPTGLKETQKKQIRESFSTVMGKHSPAEWTMVLPVDLSPKEMRWWKGFQKTCELRYNVKLSLLSGSAVSALLSKHQAIREHYFEPALARAVLSVLGAERNGVGSDKAAAITLLDQAIEVLNMDEQSWKIQANVDQDAMNFVLSARDESKPPTFRITTLPTAEGTAVAEALRAAIEQGLEWVGPGEALRVEGLPKMLSEPSEVRLLSSPPDVRLPVKLTAVLEGQEVACVPLVQLLCARAGTTVIEFTDHRTSPLAISLTLTRSGKANLRFSGPSWLGFSATAVYRAYALLGALREGAELRMEDLERGLTLGRHVVDPGVFQGEDVTQAISLFRNLSDIEQKMNVLFTLPSDISPGEFRDAHIVANILRGEPASLKPGVVKINATLITSQETQNLLGKTGVLEGGSLERSCEILGHTFVIFSEGPKASFTVASAERSSEDDLQVVFEADFKDPIVLDKVRVG